MTPDGVINRDLDRIVDQPENYHSENSSRKLSKVQRQVLVGVLLGDAHLETRNGGKTFRLKIEQSVAHAAYVQHLFDLFKDWVLAEPKVGTKQYKDRKSTNSICFQTISHSAFRFFAHQFYAAEKKCVPKLIHRWLTPRSIAYWFMDDGSIKSNQSKGVLFNTQGFDKPDVERLIEVLNSKFELQTSLRKQKDGNQIYVSGNSFETLADLIGEYLITEMRYKLPSPRTTRTGRTTMPKE